MSDSTFTGYNIVFGCVQQNAKQIPVAYAPDENPECGACLDRGTEIVYPNPRTKGGCACKWAMHASCFEQMYKNGRSCLFCPKYVYRGGSEFVGRAPHPLGLRPMPEVFISFWNPAPTVRSLFNLFFWLITQILLIAFHITLLGLLIGMTLFFFLPTAHKSAQYTLDLSGDTCPVFSDDFKYSPVYYLLNATNHDGLLPGTLTIQLDLNYLLRIPDTILVGLRHSACMFVPKMWFCELFNYGVAEIRTAAEMLTAFVSSVASDTAHNILSLPGNGVQVDKKRARRREAVPPQRPHVPRSDR